MFKSIHRVWYILFAIYIILLIVANLIFPVTFDDDFAYAEIGNPFLLQWKEYLSWHGRYISHTLLRFILQSGFQDIIISIFGSLFPFIAYLHVNSNYYQDNNPKDVASFLILSSLLYAFIGVSWSTYGMTTFFMSNIFAQMTILLFLLPYRFVINNPSYTPNLFYLFIIGIIAGSIHEQGVIIIPLLGILALFLYLKKTPPPLWFFLGCGAYFVGNLFLFLAPSMLSDYRLTTYIDIANWEFLGKTYNWLELGYKRYWYSLLNWMLFVKNGSAFILSGGIYIVITLILMINNIKKEKTWTSPMTISSTIFFIASFAVIAAMMFSPLYYQANLNWGLIYLFIALIIAYRQYIQIHDKYYKLISKLVCSVVLFIYILCFFAWNHYRIEYNNVLTKIEIAKEQNLSEVIVPPFTQFAIPTPLGNIYPVYLQRTSTFYNRMAIYYNSPPIKVQQ